MEDALAFGGALHLAAQPRRPGEGGLPRAARQRDRADHDRDRRPGLAADDLPSLRAFQPPRPRPRAARRDRFADLRGAATTTRAARSTSYFAIPAVPYLKLSAVHDDKAGTLTLFALNRSLDEAMPLRLDAGGFGKLGVKQALQLCDSDLKAVNTRDNPDRIAPEAARRRPHERPKRRGIAGAGVVERHSAHGLNGRKICPTDRTADQAIVRHTALPSTSR